MNSELKSELRLLADRYCSGLLEEAESKRLNELLHDNLGAQKEFLDLTSIHARLQWEFASPLAAKARTFDSRALPQIRNSSPWIPRSLFAASVAAVVLFSIFFGEIFPRQPDTSRDSNGIVAVLNNSLDAKWLAGFTPTTGASFQAGRLRLEQGLAEIQFQCGAKALLQAPVDLELVSGSEGYLHAGRLVVHIPHNGVPTGFRLNTPTSRMVDTGTEFGVGVDLNGQSLLQVYEGNVMATLKNVTSSEAQQRVEKGQAVQFNAASQEVPFWPERFIRVLPGPSGSSDLENSGFLPYNKSRCSEIHVLPAKTRMNIDGDLSEWDLSGQIRAACEPPYSENYRVEAALMYDDRFLYVGAHVRDPFPMRSQMSPHVKQLLYGQGGGMALRISTDRKAGWPLKAMSSVARNGQLLNAADLSEKLAFIMLWHYQPENKACIHLKYGMDLRGALVNPPGYEGAYRKDNDGLGYTLEYAIPWSLLNADDDPPKAGDELAAMVLVHWSDKKGRNWKGQLIDVQKPGEQGWNFDRAATWGKAIYRKGSIFQASPEK